MTHAVRHSLTLKVVCQVVCRWITPSAAASASDRLEAAAPITCSVGAKAQLGILIEEHSFSCLDLHMADCACESS